MSATFWTWRSSAVADTMNLYIFKYETGQLLSLSNGTFAGITPTLQTTDTLVAYPANIPSVIAVGAATDWDYRSHFSQYGPALDLVAPSNGGYAGVTTTDITGSSGATAGDYWSTFGGTSAAAPLAAGIAALMLSKNSSLTSADVRAIMQGTADKIGGNIGATSYDIGGVNQFYGFGRINAEAALAAVEWPGDYNSDMSVDNADFISWAKWYSQAVTLPNDITPGFVDQSDYQVWFTNFGRSSTSSQGSGAFVPGDYNQDSIVDDDDYDVWEQDFGSTTVLDADGNSDGVVDAEDYVVWLEMRGVTMDSIIPGDFNSDGIVNFADFELWVNEDPLADANEDEVVDELDLEIWEEHYGLTHAGVYPATLNGSGGPPLRVAAEAPRVTGVRLGGSNSTHDDYDFDSVVGDGGQLQTVPVGGLDTIYVSFSEEVLVTQESLTLHGLNAQDVPGVIDFSYDLPTQTAKWVFDTPLVADQYLIVLSDPIHDLDHDQLDGEFTNPWSLSESSGYASAFPSGDGEAGGEFRFRFTTLAGDFNHDNVVDSSDYEIWNDNDGLIVTGAVHGDGDADGDGDVDGDDYDIWLAQSSTDFAVWPSVEPGMILVSTEADENDSDYSLGDLSLREALAIAATNSGTDTIVFQPSIGQILLGSQLTINSDVNIEGPGLDDLTIDGQGASRLFMVNSGITASIAGLTITGGYVTGTSDGGGIHNNGNLTLSNTLIADNYANDAGGGIYNYEGGLTVIDSTVENNQAGRGAGIFHQGTVAAQLAIIGSAILSNDTFWNGDSGSSRGGGLYVYSFTNPAATALVKNSTFSGNTSNYGAAVNTNGSPTVTLVNVTIAENSASQQGGGIFNTGSDATITLHNTILAGNTAAGVTSTRNVGGLLNASSSYNLFGLGGTGGLSHGTNGNIVLSSGQTAGLAALGNYGGPTKSYALLAGSLAIDAGDGAQAIAFDLLTDQRGDDRIDDGDGDLLPVADIGAFEIAADEYFGDV